MCISPGESNCDTVDEQCSSHSQTETTGPAIPANWFPQNIQQIRQIIANLPETNPGYCAVFDFDNTCIFRDIGQAVFRHQLFQLEYRLDAAEFAALIPERDEPLAGKPYPVIRSTLIALYRELMEHKQRDSLPEIFTTDTYGQFQTLFFWYTAMARKDEGLGPRFVLPFLAKLLAGFTVDEMYDMAATTIQTVTEEPLVTKELQASFADPIGRLQIGYPMGMQPFAEMRQLMAELEAKGVSCKVVSASTNWLVQEAVRRFAFPVQNRNVYGIKVKLTHGNMLTTEEENDYPVTFREGKVDVIQRFIEHPIALIAGDADTDYEMLTLDNIPLRLIINHNQTGIISTLYKDSRFLLQGLDISTGSFRPARETITS
ncbi:HAD family hydrolase [Desulfogranum japonicum]|uniref:hypothetical protein n=1 Tax=Desulfogranum japonicum TaxID=231447 RepID=UPI000429630F|nr:hypothetical protein [Desulfogranum japonicum]